MLVDPTAAGPEIGLCLPVLPSGWCSPRDPQGEGSCAAGALCRLRRASSLPRGWAEVSFLALVWHCCVHCLSSSWLGSFRHLTLWFLVFQHLAATPPREAGEGLFGGDGIRQWLRLEDAVPSWACDESETWQGNAAIYKLVSLLNGWPSEWKGLRFCSDFSPSNPQVKYAKEKSYWWCMKGTCRHICLKPFCT